MLFQTAVKECLQRVLSHASDENSSDDVLKLVLNAGADKKRIDLNRTSGAGTTLALFVHDKP